MKRLYLMITITNRVVGSGRFVDFYRAFGAPVVFTALGRGTASDDVLSYLGLEATEKAVLFSVVTPACKDTLVKELVSTMHLSARHRRVPAPEQHRRQDRHELSDLRRPLQGPGNRRRGGRDHEGRCLSADRCHCQPGLYR